MRFADRPTARVTVAVAAPPEIVWGICTDLTRFGEWSPENRGGRWADDAGPGLGARFHGVQEHPGRGRWETECVVTRFDRPAAFEWRLGEPDDPGAVWGFELASDAGGTRLTEYVQMGPGPSGITDVIAKMPDKEERIIERRLAEYDAGMRAVLEGIKAASEAAVGR
ncbi:MAG: SRPBCC family protein [Acidimicrobiia bacterium]